MKAACDEAKVAKQKRKAARFCLVFDNLQYKHSPEPNKCSISDEDPPTAGDQRRKPDLDEGLNSMELLNIRSHYGSTAVPRSCSKAFFYHELCE